MGEHTPTPWCIPIGEQNGFIICAGADRNKPGPILMVLRTPLGRDSFLSDADINDNAAFIVKAVNSHDTLVKALQQIEATSSTRAAHIAREALRAISSASTPDLHGEGG